MPRAHPDPNLPEYPPSPTAHFTSTVLNTMIQGVHSLNPFLANPLTNLRAKLSCGWPCNVLSLCNELTLPREAVRPREGFRGDSGLV